MAETSDNPTPTDNNLELLYSVPVELSVQLGACMMPMKKVLELTPGSVVQLDKKADQPADLYVNDKLIAQGEIVVVDNAFGIKITKLT
ncbi:MAG: flagellar motor switch protein FliN [Limisphaerales bacterium]|jgi:flagellar motor switch protein FliN/FliY